MFGVIGLVGYAWYHCQSMTIATLISRQGWTATGDVREHRALCRRERSRHGELDSRQLQLARKLEKELFDLVAYHGGS